MNEPKYIDAEAFKRRILSYGTVHEGDRIPIPFYKHYFAKAYVAMLRWVCEEVDDTPTADVVAPRWIPVTERLPEVGSEVLVCYDFKGRRSVCISSFYGDGEFHGLDDEYLTNESRRYRKAVAWMPLPEPYKGGEEE